jgi:hypothetical protein
VIASALFALWLALPGAQTPAVITSDYYPEPKTLILHVLNNSGKDITAFTLTNRHRLPDGTSDKAIQSQITSDMLPSLINIQLAKDPREEQKQRDSGKGLFFAGTTQDIPLNGVKDASELDIAADVVFYADGTFDEQNDYTFKRMLATRQGRLLAMKRVDEIINKALADPANEHPTGAVLGELMKHEVEIMARKRDTPYDYSWTQQVYVQNETQNVKYMQEPQKGTSERQRLTDTSRSTRSGSNE